MTLIKWLIPNLSLKYNSVHKRLRLLVLGCLIAIAAVVVQPFFAGAATAFINPLASNENSSVSIPSNGKVDTVLLRSSTSQPSYIAGNWQSWEGDAQWFKQNFCNSGSQQFCPTNVASADSGKVKGGEMKITGMAAGFNTQARIVIKSWGCKFLSCAWRIRADEVLQPRTFKTWTFPSNNTRTVRIDPISGDARVHLAVTHNGNPSFPPGQLPYQQYTFCVMDPYAHKQTHTEYGTNINVARENLRKRVVSGGASIGDGACP